jgi:hypothetical protein
LATVDVAVGFAGEGLQDPAQKEVFEPIHPGAARWPADEAEVKFYGTLD